jgi:hypothetical protein
MKCIDKEWLWENEGRDMRKRERENEGRKWESQKYKRMNQREW